MEQLTRRRHWWLAVGLAGLLCASAAACGSDSDSGSDADDTEATATDTDPTDTDTTDATDTDTDATDATDADATDTDATDADATDADATDADATDADATDATEADLEAEIFQPYFSIIPSFDPHAPSALANQLHGYMVYDQLLYRGYGEDDVMLDDPVPGLATSWSFADDGSYLEFKLRDDVNFHDGTPFNAEAVKVNLERAINLPGSPWPAQLAGIESIEVIDEYTVHLNLVEGKGANLPWLFADTGSAVGRMVSPKALAEGRDIGLDPGDSGSGPYIVTDFSPGQSVTFERAPGGYWDERFPLAAKWTMTFVPEGVTRVNTLVTAGQGSLTMVTAEAYPEVLEALRNGDLTYENGNPMGERGTILGVGSMNRVFLHSNGDLTDVRVRKAASLAIDRDLICETIWNGLCQPNETLSWYPTDSIWFNQDAAPTEYDPEQARELLAEAGIPNPKLEILSLAGSPVEPITPALVAQLEAVGFDVTITTMPVGDGLAAFQSGSGDALNWATGALADPSVGLDRIVVSGYSLAPPETVDEITELSNQALDPTLSQDERAAIYHRALKLVQDSYITIDLWPAQIVWATTNDLRGNPQDLRTVYAVKD